MVRVTRLASAVRPGANRSDCFCFAENGCSANNRRDNNNGYVHFHDQLFNFWQTIRYWCWTGYFGPHYHRRDIITRILLPSCQKLLSRDPAPTVDSDDPVVAAGSASDHRELKGEKNVYRRRAEKEPEPGSPQTKPKRLRLCVDVSGSMYRFNGYDGRLQRSMECCLMLMEALKGHEQKFKYDIVGHSGDGPFIPLVDANSPPKNEKERLDVLEYMTKHSICCHPGDHALESTQLAVKQLANEDADERLVIVVSDGEFSQYGTSAAQFADAMTSDERVNVSAVLIGSAGDHTSILKRSLPVGKAFICDDTSMLPQILQSIFTSTIVSNAND